MSWLDDVISQRPRTLYRRFGAQGIYDLADVERIARQPGALVTALLFSRTETLERRITLTEAKAIYSPIGQNGYLITTREISESVFERLYRKGMGIA